MPVFLQHGAIKLRFCAGVVVIPNKEALEAKSRHFANSVFVIGAGVLMLAANLLQPFATKFLGSGMGSQVTYIVATILIFVLATKRPDLALYAKDRQCKKYGHVMSEDGCTCSRCLRTIDGTTP
jgi:hypothetical protein